MNTIEVYADNLVIGEVYQDIEDVGLFKPVLLEFMGKDKNTLLFKEQGTRNIYSKNEDGLADFNYKETFFMYKRVYE
jgi:hypothetical protein